MTAIFSTALATKSDKVSTLSNFMTSIASNPADTSEAEFNASVASSVATSNPTTQHKDSFKSIDSSGDPQDNPQETTGSTQAQTGTPDPTGKKFFDSSIFFF